MKETEKKITEYITRHGMLETGDRVLAAVSGGADSVCMLHLLLTVSKTMGFMVFAAHYEHGIRGEESLRDCGFVEELCVKLGTELLVEHGNVPEYAETHRLGTEEAARSLRYDFLERAARRLQCGRIATAHNMEDNAETVLFHLARGTGTAGLTGIPPVRGRIIRPLLCLSRSEIESWLTEHDLPHVEDSTNASDLYARNRIRHRVLPELKTVSGSAAEAIFRASELLRQDEDCLEKMAEAFTDRFQTDGSPVDVLPAEELLRLDRAVASRVIRRVWPVSLSMRQTERILSAVSSTERKHLDLPGGSMETDSGKLLLHPEPSGKGCLSPRDRSGGSAGAERNIALQVGGAVYVPDRNVRIICEECEAEKDVHDLLTTFYLKCGEIYGAVRCTRRMPGDRLRVKGRGCTKTLKSLLLEAGLTQQERNRLLIFRDDRGVLAVEGLAAAQRTAAEPGERVLKIRIERMPDPEARI